MARKTKEIKHIIILMVEGETEVEFYSSVLKTLRAQKPSIATEFHIEKPLNLKGIGNFQRSAIAQFDFLKIKLAKKSTLKDFQLKYHLFLCIDTDVFYYEKNPPLDQTALKKELLEDGADSVDFVKAEQSIEDWFLSDLAGILSYLNLKKPSPAYKKEKKGADKLNKLFNQVGKSYIKGSKTDGLVEKLDVKGIILRFQSQFQPLLELLDISPLKK